MDKKQKQAVLSNKVSKVVLFGARGALGSSLTKSIKVMRNVILFAYSHEDLDITDEGSLFSLLNQIRPDMVINAAGYTQIDRCENNLAERERAFLVNAVGVANLAKECNRISAVFVHFSSSYVFSGSEPPYFENSLRSPCNFYGRTKMLGENCIFREQEKGLAACVIRLGNLFGAEGESNNSKKSFFEQIELLSNNTKCLRIVDDEMCCFTYVEDAVALFLNLFHRGELSGIYHFYNAGALSWFDAAQLYFAETGKSVEVVPVKGTDFQRSAARGKSIVLKSGRQTEMRHFESALRHYITNSVERRT